MVNQSFKIALIGCGRIASKHVESLNQLREMFTLVAVCDLDEERAASKALQYDGIVKPTIYTDYKKLLTIEDFDIGVVATESGYHYSHVMQLLEANKHVIVEKPIALSTEHAEKMVSKAKEKGLLLSVCHQNRFNQPIQALRKAVEEKQFGKMVNGTARILWTRDQNYYNQAPWRGTAEFDGGTLMNQCIHNIDLLIWMMDSPVESVYAQTGTFLRNIEMEDFGAIIIRFQNGSIGIVEGSACVYPNNLEETLSLFGEHGTVVIGGLAVNEIKTWKFKDLLENENSIHSVKDEITNVYGNGHLALYKNVHNALIGKEKLLIDGNQGAYAMNVILAAYQSQFEGRPISMECFSGSTLKELSERKMNDKVHPTAIVEERVIMGDGCSIGPFTVIRSGVSIGKNVVIGNHVVIYEGSVIGSNVRIDDHAVIGKQPMRAATSATSNDEHQKPCHIGNDTIIGTNAILYANCVVGEACLIADYASVRENVKIGNKNIIGRNATIENWCTIGNRCKIETNAYITAYSNLEDDNFVAPGVVTSNDNYVGRDPERVKYFKGITMKNGARIGAQATILPGVTIGEESLVGAGSLVTKDTEPNKVYIGSPSRMVKEVDEKQRLKKTML